MQGGSGSRAVRAFYLHVRKSHNRPRVGNDDPFVERSYKTMKGRPDDPARIEVLQAARAWRRGFFAWYDSERSPSGAAYLTPVDLHEGRHPGIHEQRKATPAAAYAENPQRFPRPPEPAQPPSGAWIDRPTLQAA